ncbi:MAG: hypothetical protein A2X81_14710 [Desulfobacterales bacterium GWB2_56_26]|nr:MAG: hypothetical protein A2X81_14710 [Desulfobacterales bacterium GWB2_56_26]
MKIVWQIVFGAALLFVWFPYAWALDLSFQGFLQGNYTADTAASNPDGGDFKWAEERAQLQLDVAKDYVQLHLKTDAFYDHVDTDADVELREGYLDYVAPSWDVRAGRQIITWGVGDLVFINDVFPKDYEAFFSGRPLEYLKKGVDGVKAGLYPDFASFEIVVIPFFEPNNFPDPARFHLFDPIPGIDRKEEEPATSLDNVEVAVRAYRNLAGFDASLYSYRGFFRQPSALPDDSSAPTRLTLLYPELSVYGASLQRNALDGLVSLEAGYYDSREDRDGADPMLPNSQTRFLAGYQRQLWEDCTLGLQYYVEYMNDYSEYERNVPPGFPREKEWRDLVTVRLTQLLRHQTLALSWFSFWSQADNDYLLNPEVKYNLTDHLWAAVGGMIFGGEEESTQFAQLDENDNVYLQMRYSF